jgi:hypothetical protein
LGNNPELGYDRWYDIFTNEYTDKQIKRTNKIAYNIFCRLYDKLSEGNTDGMKQIIFFLARFVRLWIHW